MPRWSPHAAPAAGRVLLAVPYAEKDDAKRHGARWDSILRSWWIARRRLADFPGVHRWIPNDALARRVREGMDFNTSGTSPAQLPQPEQRHTQPDPADAEPIRVAHGALPQCACSSPPWEHCEHTLGPRVLH